MKISRDWLSDYVDFSELSAHDFSELITTRVAEVDRVFAAAAPVEHAVVGLLKRVAAHPAKPNLHVCLVELGGSEVQVVCGAPNCREGMLSAYIPAGVRVCVPGSAPGEEERLVLVEEREIAGVRSAGTLVSEAELGMTGEHLGILDLNAQFLQSALRGRPAAALRPGAKLKDCIGGPDTILEIDNKSLTHRPDLWSHFGFAREIAAILKRPLKLSADEFADDSPHGQEKLRALGSGKPEFRVHVEPGSGCRRFIALEIRNVSPVPSPFWLRRRLFSVGAGVRNLLVDLSNYVMHDWGQPNHTYDADRLSGKTIYARLARSGEPFPGLDGVERLLTAEDIAIADDRGVVALGGVMGGAPSSVSDSTTRLLLESANFDPVRIRQTTKRQALRTDASNRFEKSASPYASPLAIHRYTSLLLEMLPAAELVGPPADGFVEKPAPLFVPLRYDFIRERLGSTISDREIQGILTGLGFQETRSPAEPAVKVPYYRATRDISIEEDLVEEVGRILGYDQIPECAPKIESIAARPRPLADLEYRIQDLLRGAGFSEVYNYSFMSPVRAEELGYSIKRAITLQNPLDSNFTLVRTTLVPGMLEVLERNKRHASSLLLFELGRAYEDAQPAAQTEAKRGSGATAGRERRLLSVAYSSGREEAAAEQTIFPPLKQGADFYALLGIVRRLARLASVLPLAVEPLASRAGSSEADDLRSYKSWMHPFRSAVLKVAEKEIGIIAEVHPAAPTGFPDRAVIAEIDLGLLLAADAGSQLFKPLPKYPDSFFEMSVVLPKRTYYAELEKLIDKSVDPKVLRRIDVVAVYEGAPLKEDEKSISVRLSLGADDRTLSGAELTAIQDGLIKAVELSPYSLRV